MPVVRSMNELLDLKNERSYFKNEIFVRGEVRNRIRIPFVSL